MGSGRRSVQQDQSKPDLGSASAERPKEEGPGFSVDVIALRVEVKECCMLCRLMVF